MPKRPTGYKYQQPESRTIGPAAPRGSKGGRHDRVAGPAKPEKLPQYQVPQKPVKKPDPMPKEAENALRVRARALYPDDQDRQDAYVYGTMRQQGWKPEHHSPWDGRTYKHWYWGVRKV